MDPKTKPPAVWTRAAEGNAFAGDFPSSHIPKPAVVQPETTGAVIIALDGDPIGKQRPRLGKHGVYTPRETKSYERALGLTARAAMRGRSPIVGPCRLTVEIALPVPKNWSAKKRIDALAGRVLPTGRPDTDNVVKTAADGISGIVIADDAAVVEIFALKLYGAEPKLTIVVSPLLESRGWR